MPALGDGEVRAGRFEDPTGDAGRLRGCEPGAQRCDPARVHHRLGLFRRAAEPKVLGHAGERSRGNGVHHDAVALEFHRRDDREARDAGLRRAVVGLTGVAVDPRGRRRVDDPSVVGLAALRTLAPVRRGEARDAEGALEVDLDNRIPLFFGHVHEHPVAQDAGVVHDDVEATEVVDRLLDDVAGALPGRDVVTVGDGLAAHRFDLGDHIVRGTVGVTGTVTGPADVVHHDLGTLAGHHQRVLTADAPAGTGDDHNSSFTHLCHAGWISRGERSKATSACGPSTDQTDRIDPGGNHDRIRAGHRRAFQSGLGRP